MSLVFAAITPHPPIIIPQIGKENLKQVDKTIKALQKLERELYTAKPETIIIISPHGSLLPDNFTINLHPSYEASFEDFGDFGTKKEYQADLGLIDKIFEANKYHLPLKIISDSFLDHGASVPLFYLTPHLPNIKILPIGYCLHDYATHVEFGVRLKDIFFQTNKRIAVVASGDLSHCLTPEAPGGFTTEGKEFDEQLVKLLKNKDLEGILNLDPELVEKAGECGLRSILILLGLIKDINCQPRLLSYEGPFGVGYLVMNFEV